MKNKASLFYNCYIKRNGLISPFRIWGFEFFDPANLSVYNIVYDFFSVSFDGIPHIVAVVNDGTNVLLIKFRIDEADFPNTEIISPLIRKDEGFIDYIPFNSNYYFSVGEIWLFYTNTNDPFTKISNPIPVENGEVTTCVSEYGGRLVCGGSFGNLYFSKVGSDDFTITGNITDGLKITMGAIPKCINNINGTLIILCTNGDLYYLSGDLLTPDNAIIKKITRLSFLDFYPTTRSMININSRLFIISDNGLLELNRDIYTDSFRINLKDEMFRKYLDYMNKNWDVSINTFLRNPCLEVYDGFMIDLFSSYVNGRNESILYDIYENSYIMFNNGLNNTLKYATISNNIRYNDYGGGSADYYKLGYRFSDDYSYVYLNPTLSPETKTYNPVVKISYIPTSTNNQNLEISVYYNDKLLKTITETTTLWDKLRYNIKTKRFNISKFDGSGQYYIKFKKCEILDFSVE